MLVNSRSNKTGAPNASVRYDEERFEMTNFSNLQPISQVSRNSSAGRPNVIKPVATPDPIELSAQPETVGQTVNPDYQKIAIIAGVVGLTFFLATKE